MSDIDQICKNCKFAFGSGMDGNIECRRYAPSPVVDPTTNGENHWDFYRPVWPVMYDDDVCGEFKPSQTPPAKPDLAGEESE